MKQINIFILIIVSSILFSLQLNAQKSEMGIHVGYGNATFDYNATKFIFTDYKDFGQFYSIGLRYYRTMKGDMLSFNTGLDYDRRTEAFYNSFTAEFGYLRIPLGLDLIIGKKFQFIAGGGGSASYLISHSNVFKGLNKLQLGVYFDLGIAYQITEKYHISLIYKRTLDMIASIKYSRYSPGGAPYSEEIFGQDSYVSLCLRYRLSF